MVLKRFGLALLLVLSSLSVWADETYVLKFATLAPQGSTWANILVDWAAKVEKESQGRLKFKLYPGGVSGDEPDVLRKIRFGQLQGGRLDGSRHRSDLFAGTCAGDPILISQL